MTGAARVQHNKRWTFVSACPKLQIRGDSDRMFTTDRMKNPQLEQTASAAIVIRGTRRSDQADLLRLIRAYYRFDGIRFRPASVEKALRRLLQSRALGRVWLMLDSDKAIGYVGVAAATMRNCTVACCTQCSPGRFLGFAVGPG
jgi:hypothetical protein